MGHLGDERGPMARFTVHSPDGAERAASLDGTTQFEGSAAQRTLRFQLGATQHLADAASLLRRKRDRRARSLNHGVLLPAMRPTPPHENRAMITEERHLSVTCLGGRGAFWTVTPRAGICKPRVEA